MPDVINEPTLLKCAVKKSSSVFGKHLLYAAYAVDSLAALVIFYYMIVLLVIPQVITPLLSIYTTLLMVVSALAVAIPWYCYFVAGIPALYFGYGLFWCIDRELTYEDLHSWEAQLSSIISCAGCGFLLLMLCLGDRPTTLFAGLIIIAAILTTILVGVVCFLYGTEPVLDDNVRKGRTYHVTRFMGAYLHHTSPFNGDTDVKND